jgi:hypothetical protein
MQVACGGCHTMVLANKRQGDEDELDFNELLDAENEVWIFATYVFLQRSRALKP